MRSRPVFPDTDFDGQGRYCHITVEKPGKPIWEMAMDRISHALKRAVILEQREYMARVADPVARAGACPWMAAASSGRVVRVAGRPPELELDRVFVNATLTAMDPRLGELLAIEEAGRYAYLAHDFFGSEGRFADPEALGRVIMEASDPAAIKSITPEQVIVGGCIDPSFQFRDARRFGLEMGRDDALDREDDELVRRYTNANLTLAGHVANRTKVPFIQETGEEQLRLMREVYRSLFD